MSLTSYRAAPPRVIVPACPSPREEGGYRLPKAACPPPGKAGAKPSQSAQIRLGGTPDIEPRGEVHHLERAHFLCRRDGDLGAGAGVLGRIVVRETDTEESRD